jgi:hypothetical protein
VPNTSELSGFNTKWRDLYSYARQNNLSIPALTQVYDLDYQRLAGGTDYQLSKSEALAAIQSASQGAPTTAAPNPPFSAGNIPSYLGTNAKDIGVGLFGLIKKGISDVIHPMNGPHELEALWTNPAVIIDPFKSINAPANEQTMGGPDSMAQTWARSPLLSATVPALADVALAEKGKAGWKEMAEQPLSTLLDIIPELRAGGVAARSLARAGLDDGTLATLDEASKYKPSDISTQAQAARAAAGDALGSAIRRALAMNQHGLAGALYRLVLDAPFGDDTVGSYLSTRVTQATRGQLGPVAASLGRVVQMARREAAEGGRRVVADIGDFYPRNGLTTPKEVRDFGWIATHYQEDWKTAYAAMLDPGEASKLENAFRDYDNLVEIEKQKDLARDRLGTVTDPRDGHEEVRATSGTDATVIARHNEFLKRTQAADKVLADLADLTGNDMPRDPAAAGQAILNYVTQAVVTPAAPWLSVDGRDELAVRRQFPPTKPVGAGEVDPNNPQAVQELLRRGGRPQSLRWRREEVMRAGRLMGPGGLFAHLKSALAGGRMTDAERILRSIESTMKTAYARSSPELSRLLPDVTRARSVLQYSLKSSTTRAIEAFSRSRDALTKAIDKFPEARYTPRLAELVHDRLLEHLNGQDISDEDMALLGYQVANGIWKGETFSQIVGAGEMAKIINGSLKMLRTERDAGLSPKFVYSSRGGEIERLGDTPTPERITSTRSAKSRARFNPSAVYEPVIGITRKMLEDVEEAAAHEMFYGEQGIITRWAVPFDDTVRQAQQLIETPDDPEMLRHAIDAWQRQNYAELDPQAFFPRKASELTGASGSTPTLVPIAVKQSLDATYKALHGSDNLAARAYGKGTSLFRYTLLNFSPRYQVHIWAGGSVLLLLRSDPISMARVLPAALGMMIQDSDGLLRHVSEKGGVFAPVLDWLKVRAERRGEFNGMPLGLPHEVAEADPAHLTNEFNYAVGKKGASLFAESLRRRGITNAGMTFASFGANMLRSMAYLIGKASDVDVDAGVRFALKVFADMDGMTPLERSIIRYFMPFYGWTKHILEYTATYPIDHPYRAAVLSQMIAQEWQDWNTGIPQSMMYLFQIGGVNANGDVTAVDLRQLDPLRSVTDVFTMAGFLSSLNPAIQNVVLPAIGVNPASGGPEDLYPQMTIDSFYGTEQPVPQNPLNVLENGIAGYVPQATAIETALSMTSYARWAKVNDPNAYKQAIAGALSVPWIPETINLKQVEAQTEIDRYNVARDAATAALNDPNPNSPTWKALMQYGYVPYQGWLVQPAALRQWAFDTAIQQGYWNGSMATIAPSNLITPPYGPTIQ